MPKQRQVDFEVTPRGAATLGYEENPCFAVTAPNREIAILKAGIWLAIHEQWTLEEAECFTDVILLRLTKKEAPHA